MRIKSLFFIVVCMWLHLLISSPPTTESLTGQSTRKRPRLLARVGTAIMHGVLPRCVYHSGVVEEDDDWMVVQDPEFHARTVVEASQDTLQREVRRLTGASSGSTDRSKIIAADPVEGLTQTSEELWTHMTRMCEDYGALYHETLQANFVRFEHFDPTSVYRHLGYENHAAAQLPYERFKTLIEQREQETDDDDTKWLMRQFGFMFRNETSKHLYDVYLAGGTDAINKLSLTAEEVEHLGALRELSLEAKADLEEHRRSVARVSAQQEEARKKRSQRKKSRCVIS